MKLFAKTVTITLFSTTAAVAGNLSDPVVETVVESAAPAAPSWEGIYGGVMGGQTSAAWEDNPDTKFITYGAFAGYNHVMNSGAVLGGELAYNMGSYDWGDDTSDVKMIDAKARLGFAFGNALIYGFGGYSLVTEETTNVSYGPYKSTGWNAGAGIDFLVTDNVFVGAEYIHRDVVETSGDWPFKADTISARVGVKY